MSINSTRPPCPPPLPPVGRSWHHWGRRPGAVGRDVSWRPDDRAEPVAAEHSDHQRRQHPAKQPELWHVLADLYPVAGEPTRPGFVASRAPGRAASEQPPQRLTMLINGARQPRQPADDGRDTVPMVTGSPTGGRRQHRCTFQQADARPGNEPELPKLPALDPTPSRSGKVTHARRSRIWCTWDNPIRPSAARGDALGATAPRSASARPNPSSGDPRARWRGRRRSWRRSQSISRRSPAARLAAAPRPGAHTPARHGAKLPAIGQSAFGAHEPLPPDAAAAASRGLGSTAALR